MTANEIIWMTLRIISYVLVFSLGVSAERWMTRKGRR